MNHRMNRRGGFTLIEVLATLVLLAIVLPALSEGIHLASSAAGDSRHRTEAAGLAESKLNELIATGDWQSGQTAGDFAPDFPNYRWQATLSSWQYDNTSVGIQQLDVQISWVSRGHPDSLTISSLVYAPADGDSSSTGSSTGTSGTSGSSGATGGTNR